MRIHIHCCGILCCGLLFIATCFAQGEHSEQAGGALPVATVEGQPIMDGELTPLVEGQIRQLQYQEYLIRRKALDDLINQKLVAVKAKEKGLTPEEFLQQTIDSKLPEPNDAEVQAFYFHQRNLSNVPFEQVKTQLRAALKQQNVERARQDYFQSLRQSSNIAVNLRPPRVQVRDDAARTLGSPGAPVTIIEFADFECPYCQRANSILGELLKKYNGQVRLAFRDFPLDEIHPGSERAAEAGRCANEQGKFWAYHDMLFSSPGRLAEADLRQQAHQLGMDETQFDACLHDHKFKSQIEEDVRAGIQAGVSGTPGFFINGVFLNGLQPLATFENTIEEELASLKAKPTTPETGAN